MASSSTENQMKKPERTGDSVWKFGYGSNMSQDFIRSKKGLNPLDCCRTILKGYSLSFPEGRGIDFVEPAFATLKKNPDGFVHGVSTLLSLDDANKLDAQEGSYDIAICPSSVYEDQKELYVEVYVPRSPLPFDHPEGCCSVRYRDVLVKGGIENSLDADWIEKLKNLKTYSPCQNILDCRIAQPSPSELPQMTIEELSLHNGEDETKPIYVSSCGYIFETTPMFKVMRGRDITNRNAMHMRGLNLEIHDDNGKSPFPKLSKLSSNELEYALQYRDRFIAKTSGPIAVLKEFWEEQEDSFEGVYKNNTLSLLSDRDNIETSNASQEQVVG
mmetsp:Transcript_19224/g.25036  ORF Transcript_19224/g.25036 Transcript_19224/m.25036 type:complete len:330 (-) Transcript_19224:97-1086(-)